MSSGRSVTGRAKPCYCLTTDGFGRTAEQARGQNGWILAKLLFCLLRRTNTIKTLIINRMFSLATVRFSEQIIPKNLRA